MSEFKFSCPHCAQHLQCEESLGGKQITCPNCHHLIHIPLSPAQQAAGNYSVESGRTWDTFMNRPSPPKVRPPAPVFEAPPPPAPPPPPTLRQRLGAWLTGRKPD